MPRCQIGWRVPAEWSAPGEQGRYQHFAEIDDGDHEPSLGARPSSAQRQQLRMSSDAVLFAGGVVALTLAEYLVHRFVLHGFAPIEHRLHHAHPDGAVLTIFWQIWICFALVYLIAGGAFVAAR